MFYSFYSFHLIRDYLIMFSQPCAQELHKLLYQHALEFLSSYSGFWLDIVSLVICVWEQTNHKCHGPFFILKIGFASATELLFVCLVLKRFFSKLHLFYSWLQIPYWRKKHHMMTAVGRAHHDSDSNIYWPMGSTTEEILFCRCPL